MFFLIGITQQWAGRVEKYKEDRQKIIEKWKEEEKQHLENIENADKPTDRFFGFGEQSNNRAEAVDAMRSDFDKRKEQAKQAWRDFLDDAEEISDRLKEGATKENIKQLQEGGHLGWAPFNITGDRDYNRAPKKLDDVRDDPEMVNLWWENLDEDEKEEWKEERADQIRDLDGIPAEVRDALNREHLDEEIKDRKDELENPTAAETYGVDIKSEKEEELETLEQLRKSLDGDNYLLSLDTQNEGRAIVASGNPDTADNIGTLVPGTTTDWTSVNGQMNRAEALREAAKDADGDAEHATIAWIGYDAPDVHEAVGSGKAEGATAELSRFQEGLRATHQGQPSNNTVIGHSYGSTVVGHTAQNQGSGYEHDGTGSGIDADNLMFVGSPGVDAGHVSDLNFTGANVHASVAENDGISSFTGLTHGADPTGADFGATQFESDPGTEGGTPPLWDAHSEYSDRRTPSLEYMGEVIAGEH